MFQLFKNSLKNGRDFISRIRKEDESVRKRWLLIFSVPTIVIVVAAWAGYMSAVSQSEQEKLARATEPNAAEVFGAGLKVVGERAKRGGEKVGNLLGNTVGSAHSFTIDIELDPPNFIVDDLEAIPKVELP